MRSSRGTTRSANDPPGAALLRNSKYINTKRKKIYEKCIISITLPDGIKSIDNYAFSGCTSLVSINIPCSVTSIGEEAFYNCSGLEDVIISDSVETIGVKAFSLCENLKSVIIGKNVNF